MADRHPFGGQISDWVFVKNSDDIPVFSGGAVLQFWNSRDGGTQYTDLTTDAAGTVPVGTLLSSNGSDGYQLGDIPAFYGPPSVTFMYVSADGGPRRAIGSLDSADLAGQDMTGLAQHVQAQNPHGTTLDTLADVSISTKTDGAFVAWDAVNNRYTLAATTGLNPADFVKVAGGSTIRIPDGNTTTTAQSIRVPAGDRSAAPDTFKVEWNAGTNGSPVWVESFWLDPYGAPRSQATADNRIAFKVLRKSASATADLFQACTESGSPLAWITPNGSVKGANIGRSVSFTRAGSVTAGVGKFSWVNLCGVPVVLKALWMGFDTAGTGTSTFDVNLNGTTLYPTGKPTIASGVKTSGIITAAFTIPAGGVVTVDVDAAGTGADSLTAQLEIQ